MTDDLFKKHFGPDQALNDLTAVRHVLPDDVATLRKLAGKCEAAGRQAARAGKQFEVQRLALLAQQLRAEADKLLKA